MADNDRLEAVMAWVETHPNEHYQGAWAQRIPCGTALCFAGAAAVLGGATLEWQDGLEQTDAAVLDGHRRSIPEIAARLLDLTSNQANRLFYGAGTPGELRYVVDRIKADPRWDPYAAFERAGD